MSKNTKITKTAPGKEPVPPKYTGGGKDPFGSLKSFLEGEEKERQRLSRELHDGIGQYLIAIKMKLESLLYVDDKEVKDNIRSIKDDFDKTVEEIRRMSNNLMPSVLEAFGIIYALRNLCIDTSDQTGIRINLSFKGDLESLNMTIKTYLFRIAQEALANIVKHARAGVVDLNLERTKDDLFFTIGDNGKGFPVKDLKSSPGHGIKNISDRVTLLSGTLEIHSEPDHGTKIHIRIPPF